MAPRIILNETHVQPLSRQPPMTNSREPHQIGVINRAGRGHKLGIGLPPAVRVVWVDHCVQLGGQITRPSFTRVKQVATLRGTQSWKTQHKKNKKSRAAKEETHSVSPESKLCVLPHLSKAGLASLQPLCFIRWKRQVESFGDCWVSAHLQLKHGPFELHLQRFASVWTDEPGQ
jgi:hypothetical protein